MAIKDDREDVQEAVINELITENGLTPLTVGPSSITPAKLDRAYLESTGGTVTGNVGIGGSPVSVGTGHPTLNLKGDTAGQPDRSGAVRFERQDGTQAMYIAHSDGDNRIAGIGSYPLTFRTNNTERMRIQSNGTIKISNSSTPSTPSGGGVLYVQNGALKFKGSSGTVTTIANA